MRYRRILSVASVGRLHREVVCNLGSQTWLVPCGMSITAVTRRVVRTQNTQRKLGQERDAHDMTAGPESRRRVPDLYPQKRDTVDG
jgi:hypothetical protein